METIKIKGNDYEVIDQNRAELYANKYGYWCVKDADGLNLGEKNEDEEITGVIEENGGEFGILLCQFQNSKQDKKSIKRCVFVHDEATLKGIRKNEKLGNANPEVNNTSSSKISNPYNQMTQFLAMQEKLKSNLVSDMQTQMNFQTQFAQMQATMMSEAQKAEYLRLEAKLESEWRDKKRDLERDFERKELEFVKREMLIESREQKLEDLEADLEDREFELKEEKQKFEAEKKEYREGNKKLAEGITEGTLSGLGGALLNTFAPMISSLNGVKNEKQEDEDLTFMQTPKTNKKPKPKFSFVKETEAEEVQENE